MIFHDREDAGKQLAQRLQIYQAAPNTLVVGLARGGVVVAAALAEALKLPMNLVVVRKVGAPHNEELALGAVTESGEGIFNDHLITLLGVSQEYLKGEIERQKKVAEKRLSLYRGTAAPLHVQGMQVILVDDGIATGASMRVAIKALKAQKPAKLTMAVPVASPDALQKICLEVDETICLFSPTYFESVGAFYQIFDQVNDEDIVDLFRT